MRSEYAWLDHYDLSELAPNPLSEQLQDGYQLVSRRPED